MKKCTHTKEKLDLMKHQLSQIYSFEIISLKLEYTCIYANVLSFIHQRASI